MSCPWLALLTVCLGCWTTVEAASKFPIVLVVSMDAFRHDYVDNCLTPTITKLRSSGVYAPYMKNVFPTKTFPNHHSLATGVQPEVHGVLDSSVYTAKDGCSNRSILHYGEALFHYDNNIIPIWTLNQLGGKGRHSGVMMWPGGEFPYGCKKTLPTFRQSLNEGISFEDRIDTVISWLNHPEKPANLVMMYFQEPDAHGHAFGIFNREVDEQIKKLDKSLDYLTKQLKKNNLDKLVTVFVVSDHGMINQIQQRILDLNDFVDNSTYVVAGSSPVLQIFPTQGKEEYVKNGLLKAQEAYHNTFDVYSKDQIPSIWHYKHNNRTPPIFVVAKEGYAFQDFYKVIEENNQKFGREPNPGNIYGIHGYSNSLSSMHPLFFAWGPLVRTGVELDPFNSTELYPLWASVLGLELEHEVFSTPNFSMLLSDQTAPTHASNMPDLPSSPSGPLSQSSRGQTKGGAPLWMYWFSGLIAILLLVVITGMVVYFCRDFHQATSEPTIFRHPRTDLENQNLLVSESEEELKL